MGVGSVGGEKCTFGNVESNDDFELTDLPAIASCQEIDLTDFIEVTVRTFATNFLATMSDTQANAATLMGVKSAVIKCLAGEILSIPVSGNQGKLYVAAETGGPITDDLQIIKVRGT